MRKIYTSLAIEAHEEASRVSKSAGKLNGVEIDTKKHGDMIVTTVTVSSKEGEEALKKPMGTYITMEVPSLNKDTSEVFESCCELLGEQIRTLLPQKKDASILVAGLGNRFVTPDSLGPKTVDSIMVTRHLLEYMPQYFSGYRPVSAIAPGVLGITGIETADILRGVIEQLKPDAIIVIDALASRRLSRLCTTFQICDTGLSPGSGVGNTRLDISSKNLNVPVIAIGVPTVVDAATLVCDCLDLAMDDLQKTLPGLTKINPEKHYGVIADALNPFEANLMVTPKQIDDLIAGAAKITGYGINRGLHPDVSIKEITQFLS